MFNKHRTTENVETAVIQGLQELDETAQEEVLDIMAYLAWFRNGGTKTEAIARGELLYTGHKSRQEVKTFSGVIRSAALAV